MFDRFSYKNDLKESSIVKIVGNLCSNYSTTAF